MACEHHFDASLHQKVADALVVADDREGMERLLIEEMGDERVVHHDDDLLPPRAGISGFLTSPDDGIVVDDGKLARIDAYQREAGIEIDGIGEGRAVKLGIIAIAVGLVIGLEVVLRHRGHR